MLWILRKSGGNVSADADGNGFFNLPTGNSRGIDSDLSDIGDQTSNYPPSQAVYPVDTYDQLLKIRIAHKSILIIWFWYTKFIINNRDSQMHEEIFKEIEAMDEKWKPIKSRKNIPVFFTFTNINSFSTGKLHRAILLERKNQCAKPKKPPILN